MSVRIAWSFVCLVLITSTSIAQDKGELFGLSKVYDLHLQLTAREWERMQAITGGLTLFPPKRAVPKEGEEPFEWHKTAGFGIEFPWAHADLVIDGKLIKNVGLRYKGNGSYVSSEKFLKRNLKIEIDHYEEGLRYQGLKMITLNAGAVDATRMREALAYAVFRSAGVPAPRTAFAKVTLSVTGKYDKEFVGLYTFVEHVDKAFLKEHFKDGKGLLMKPERMRGVDYLGEDWKRYASRFNLKREATEQESKRVIEIAKLVSKGSDDDFNKNIGNYLDIDKFLRFIAVNTMLPNTDNFMTTGHNYYIYLNPKTDKLVFMPWDLDIAFAGFPLMGSVDQQVNMNLLKPAQGRLKLVDRLLAIPEVNEQYRKVLKDIAENAFAKKKLLSEIDVMDKAIREPLALEAKAKAARKEQLDPIGAWVQGMLEAPPPMRSFVERRTDAVMKQIAAMAK